MSQATPCAGLPPPVIPSVLWAAAKQTAWTGSPWTGSCHCCGHSFVLEDAWAGGITPPCRRMMPCAPHRAGTGTCGLESHTFLRSYLQAAGLIESFGNRY